MQKRILVIGGTGMLGRPVSHSLKEAGFRVRILTRDQSKARAMFDDSFEIVAGEPTDDNSLNEALHGCAGVHISLPNEAEQQVTEAVAKAASGQEIERISYISGATVAEEHRWFPMINRKFLAEQAIRESRIPYTVFCPTWVMETLPLFVVGGRATVMGTHHGPYHWVAADDIATLVSTSYGLEGAANNRFVVLGPEAISMHEALRRYCFAFHPEIKKVSTMPSWLLKTFATITRSQELKSVAAMMSYFERIGERGNPKTDNAILGAPAITLDMWLERRKSRER